VTSRRKEKTERLVWRRSRRDTAQRVGDELRVRGDIALGDVLGLSLLRESLGLGLSQRGHRDLARRRTSRVMACVLFRLDPSFSR
jgi:hypothetical protein